MLWGDYEEVIFRKALPPLAGGKGDEWEDAMQSETDRDWIP